MVLLVSFIDAIMVRIFHRPVTDLIAAGTLAVVLVMWPLDAFTVRLVQARRWRGWLRGYET
jgi:hypothetical protein